MTLTVASSEPCSSIRHAVLGRTAFASGSPFAESLRRRGGAEPVKIAYLMNTYPLISTTFIRREIEALEADGVEVERFAGRRWNGVLVDPQDIAEQQRTHYLLAGNVPCLIAAFFVELLFNPAGLAQAAGVAFRLWRNARGGFVRHVAYLLQAIHFKQQVIRQGVEHVHTHFATNATAIALLSRALGGPSYSFTAHGPEEFENTDRLSFDLKMRQAKFIVAISEFGRVQLIRASHWSHWSRIAIVHCGLAMPDFAPSPNPANQVLVNIARFNSQKGLLLIPAAVAAVKDEFPGLKVVLIGDGEERPRLEAEIARHRVAGQIELRGWQSNAEVRRTLAGSRALLLPSFAEGLPVVVMEAFALGRPVISTFIAGIPELVDASCGWLAPAGDVEALAAAMRDALSADPRGLARMGDEARRRAMARHDIAASARQLKALFAQAAAPAVPVEVLEASGA
jgi:glycosyltransferase involved in cell wall biosynthesis